MKMYKNKTRIEPSPACRSRWNETVNDKQNRDTERKLDYPERNKNM